MLIERRWSKTGQDAMDCVAWQRSEVVVRRTGARAGAGAAAELEKRDVEAPAGWSPSAVTVVAGRYLRRRPRGERESSVRQLIGRIVGTLREWAAEAGVFEGDGAAVLADELTVLLLRQQASFNSPVWYNVGLKAPPQCAASFINGVDDEMSSVLALARVEGLQHRNGSGSGVNLSSLRAEGEPIAWGESASGPVPFMRGLDALAGATKRGGLRRAARMVVLDVEHPDIVAFVRCKRDEERKAWALVDAAFEAGFHARGGAYDSVAFQNSNHSVRVSDAFMSAAAAGGTWWTRSVLSGGEQEEHDARALLGEMAEAAWVCGDPGILYGDTINAWHTCPASGPIRATNSCSEFLFVDGTACILASLNLLRFDAAAGFDVASYEHACRVVLAALDTLVGGADYGDVATTLETRRHRPVGLGYANLGALLMGRGLPYDSDEGRAFAAAVTALTTGVAYRTSAELAARLGPYDAFADNREQALAVLRRHREVAATLALGRHGPAGDTAGVLAAAVRAFERAVELAERTGLRNAQLTLLAPVGTICFMMDCDTTGVEPETALVKYKQLADGGVMKIVNRTVPAALARLGYAPEAVAAVVAHVSATGTIEGAPGLSSEHLPVFDCAFVPPGGSRAIHFRGHLRMMAALQPLLSGGISKTVNMPSDCTPDDIADVYLEGWRMGLKAVAVYRDGSKRSQPLTTAPVGGRAGSTVASAFRFLTRAERDELLAAAESRRYDTGEVIIVEGEPAGGLFVIDRGRARVEVGEAAVPVGELWPDAVAGEVSFISPDSAATATVVALEPTVVRIIPERALRGLIAGRPGLSSRLYQSLAALLAERLTRVNHLVEDPSRSGGPPSLRRV